MRRRDYLGTAASGVALLGGATGSASAFAGWGRSGDDGWSWPGRGRRGDDPGDGGDGDLETEFEITGQGELGDEPGAEVECAGREVSIEGTIEVSDSCASAALGSAEFEDGTLSVVVEEERRNTMEVCAPATAGVSYTLTATAPTAVQRVEVTHQAVSERTIEHECGDGGDGEVDVDFAISQQGSGSGDPGADVTCTGTEAQIEGVIEVRDSCHTAALAGAEFGDGTLTVTVEETEREESQVCLPAVTPVGYTATATTPGAIERVEVVHEGVSGETFEHECGDGGEEIQTDFEVGGQSPGSAQPGVDVECSGTEVVVDGVIQARNSCYSAELGGVELADGTLTVTVTETRVSDSDVCLQVVTPVEYVATITTPTAVDRVEVVHEGVSGETFEHECGTGSDGDGTDGDGTDGDDGDGTDGDGGGWTDGGFGDWTGGGFGNWTGSDGGSTGSGTGNWW